MSRTKYAFGADVVDDRGCPAVQAGYNPCVNHDVLAVAEVFDNTVIRQTNHQFGDEVLLDEPIAKMAWESTLDEIQQSNTFGPDIEAIAIEIAKSLGWHNITSQ